METKFEALQQQWQNNKKDIENKSYNIKEVIATITAKKKSSTRFHYGNIMVLSITVIIISAFFYYVAPVKEILSRIGVGLMIGGLLVRICIEIISVLKSKKIKMIDNALQTTKDTIGFYDFRKKIHGPITITIFVLYSVGFYMISPEFSLYFTTSRMILMDVSYIFIAVFLIVVIRKGIKKEIRILGEVIQLKEKMVEVTKDEV